VDRIEVCWHLPLSIGFPIFTPMKFSESISDMKVDLTKLVMATEDQALLAEIYAILLNANSNDGWYDRLDDEDKEEIRLGEQDFEAGRISEQDEMMERIKACNRK
jgi:hypothetical protein